MDLVYVRASVFAVEEEHLDPEVSGLAPRGWTWADTAIFEGLDLAGACYKPPGNPGAYARYFDNLNL